MRRGASLWHQNEDHLPTCDVVHGIAKKRLFKKSRLREPSVWVAGNDEKGGQYFFIEYWCKVMV